MKIAGSDINIDHADIKGKNIQDLKKLDIFSHLSNDDQGKAYEELAKEANTNYGPVIKVSMSQLEEYAKDNKMPFDGISIPAESFIDKNKDR